jgi:Zn-dependent protease
MNLLRKGCFPLFTVAGVKVLMHWSWFLVAYVQVMYRDRAYPSRLWNVAEYLALFGIVLFHEFGHVFACRQVGGKAERIILWPLGGIAYVTPPPRPGALLWSIAGGPLVNLALVPVTIALWWLVNPTAPWNLSDPATHFFFFLALVNLCLLVFNLLPIYPLDGGQILHALLWFVLGRARSLMVASVIGMVGAGGLFVLALYDSGPFLFILAAFVSVQAVGGFLRARTLAWLQPVLDQITQAQVAGGEGDFAEAIDSYDRALALLPPGHQVRADTYACRATLLLEMGNDAGAAADFDEAIRLRPGQAPYHVNRGLSYAHQGQYDRAVEDYLEAVRLDPRLSAAQINLAWLLATSPDPCFRDSARAVAYARRACELTHWKEPSYLGTLAAALAESGDYAGAVAWQKKALEDPDYWETNGKDARERLQLYEEGKPYRDNVIV